jgi:hypothetical protein
MKKMQIAVLVIVALTVSTVAMAQMTPRSVGMGGAVVGVADDAAAWVNNPAGLPGIKLTAEPGGSWDGIATGSWGTNRGTKNDVVSLTASMKRTPDTNWGVGVGYLDSERNFSALGAGFGYQFKDSPLSVGASLYRVDPDFVGASAETAFDLGFMYSFAVEDREPVKVGLVVRDLTQDIFAKRTFDIGASWKVAPQWLVALDVEDITDESNAGPFISGGVEYTFGTNMEWKARAGFADDGNDHNMTLGAGYDFGKWSVDAAFVNIKGGDFWTVGGSIGF